MTTINELPAGYHQRIARRLASEYPGLAEEDVVLIVDRLTKNRKENFQTADGEWTVNGEFINLITPSPSCTLAIPPRRTSPPPPSSDGSLEHKLRVANQAAEKNLHEFHERHVAPANRGR